MTYNDVVNMYGLSRAGYVPQVFSIRLPNPDVIFELLERARAKALIYEKSFEPIIAGCPVATHLACSLDNLSNSDAPLPLLHDGITRDDPAFIFHTSGSTSGSPKLVPCSYTWLQSIIEKMYHATKPLALGGKADVTVWL
jgi:acyl-coenzyme A synthetase/AMP-(fatty) acid ligase